MAATAKQGDQGTLSRETLWNFKPQAGAAEIERLSKQLNMDPLIAQLLLQRGISDKESARAFFRPKLSHLHDPFLMKDMDRAVARIELAMHRGERILVYGDYDVDGTTAVALMSSFLMETHPEVATYIPDRYREGYGLSFQGIDYALDNDMTLIIALDCGIKASEQIVHAKEHGIDVIVCDHHLPGEELPPAVAILDPKRADCDYPYKELCGCGVGFKLIQALGQKWGKPITGLVPYLDLVATAIGADVVPLTGENRVLAHYGLQVINRSPRTGIKALVELGKKKHLNLRDVIFQLAPKINAAGRIDHGQQAVALLTATDYASARAHALEIDAFNQERRELEKDMVHEALTLIRDQGEESRFTSVVYKEDWHKGVIGIVASRLMDTYYRPTLVFTKSGDRLAASARSVKGFDIYRALEGCSRYLEQFGGHSAAAGLTLLEDRYEAFKLAFEAEVRERLEGKRPQRELEIDARIDLDRIDATLVGHLKEFAPFGPGNPLPVFMAEGLRDSGHARGVGGEGEHLKAFLAPGSGKGFGAIGFGLGHKLGLLQENDAIDAVFTLEENHWNGQVEIQLNLCDLR